MENWVNKAVFYHIYPLGFCNKLTDNAPAKVGEGPILRLKEWITHFKKLGVNAVYFSPIFESVSHGYDTVDYYRIDKRLGSNEEFKEVCQALHRAGIRVVLDGVFNHVGRDFIPFKDVQQYRGNSIYKDWFVNVNFNGNSPYGDGFSYKAWEGYYNLVELNLRNPAVKEHLFGAIKQWITEYEIDGLRLDVAYCMDEGFLRELRDFVDREKEDFWLMGEMIHGDYRRLIQPNMLESTTNYECYKGIYSSHNDKNYFEINYSLNRLFGRGGIYEGMRLYNFVDNHDVARIGSQLKNINHIYDVYTMLFTMPGIPSIYYGSEWRIEGKKEQGSDNNLRPALNIEEMKDREPELVQHIRKLSDIRGIYAALQEGGYEQVIVRNEQLIFLRQKDQYKAYIALNLADYDTNLQFKADGIGELVNVLKDEEHITNNYGQFNVSLKAYESKVFVPTEQYVKIEPIVEVEEKLEPVEEVVEIIVPPKKAKKQTKSSETKKATKASKGKKTIKGVVGEAKLEEIILQEQSAQDSKEQNQQVEDIKKTGVSEMYKQLIKDYQPINEQEASEKRVIVDYIEQYPENILLRNNEFGHLTSSGLIVNKELTKVLMIYHNIYKAWAWTGGHADGDADLLAVAIKEAKEETGIAEVEALTGEIDSIDILPVWGHEKRGVYVPTHMHLSVAYILIADEHQEIRIKPDENSGVKWIEIDQLEKYCDEKQVLPIYYKLIEKAKAYKKV